MIERLFFDRVDAKPTRASVGGKDYRVVEAASNKAKSTLTFSQTTEARAEIALDATIIDAMPVPCRNDARISDDLDIHDCLCSMLHFEALLTATSVG
jgi:hypothetical protein